MNYKLETRTIDGKQIQVKVYAKSARKYTGKQMFLHERGLLEQSIQEASEEIDRKKLPFELQYLLDEVK